VSDFVPSSAYHWGMLRRRPSMWRFLSSPFYHLSGLPLSSTLANISAFVAATCARGARMRGASLPPTTCYPCRPLYTDHPILHALLAPGERRGGQPLLQIGPQRAPCLLSSCPPQPNLAARPSAWLETHRRFEGRPVRQAPRLDKPPHGHEQLARQGDNPAPA
jgi:hypothetical protein